MADIKPFQINIPDKSLADLKQKLELTRFPEGELEEAAWDYGIPFYTPLSPSSHDAPLILQPQKIK